MAVVVRRRRIRDEMIYYDGSIVLFDVSLLYLRYSCYIVLTHLLYDPKIRKSCYEQKIQRTKFKLNDVVY